MKYLGAGFSVKRCAALVSENPQSPLHSHPWGGGERVTQPSLRVTLSACCTPPVSPRHRCPTATPLLCLTTCGQAGGSGLRRELAWCVQWE